MKRKSKLVLVLSRVAYLCFGFCLFSIPGLVLAAGFSCEKAFSSVEKIICDDKGLSALDSSLADLYGKLKESNPDLAREQKIWLRQKRNVCQTTSCLMAVYDDRIVALKKINACPANEASLQGSWVRIKGEWAFEKMQLSIQENKKEFTSWLHNHLEMIGTWQFEKCTIYIRHDTEDALQFYLKIKKLDNGRLYLFDTDSQSELVYKLIQ